MAVFRQKVNFTQISYRLWSRGVWCTTNFQGRLVKRQGRGV